MNQKLIFFLICCTALFQSCSSETAPAETTTKKPTTPQETTYNYASDKTKNLNVVYFIPNDVTAPVDYHRRLSEILLNIQDFFGTEMQCNGYGNKTFGLLKDDVKKRMYPVLTGMLCNLPPLRK